MLNYTQSVYINNNTTKLEPLPYIQTKEIIESHTKYYNVFKIITLTTVVIIIISILLYLWYKFKSIPRKLIVKHVKPKQETPKSTEIVNDLPHQIIIEENVMLYSRLSA